MDKKTTNRLVVDTDLLEYDEDISCLNERPYSGIGIIHHLNGRVSTISSYVEGFPDGEVREWDDQGNLIKLSHCVKRRTHGERVEWFAGGAVKSRSIYEWGLEVWHQEYAPDGTLLVSRAIKDENDDNYPLLLRLRQIYGNAD